MSKKETENFSNFLSILVDGYKNNESDDCIPSEGIIYKYPDETDEEFKQRLKDIYNIPD